MSVGNPLTIFEDDSVRSRFLAHYDTVRGAVRSEVVRRHLTSVLPDVSGGRRLRVLDIGCGDGRDALWFASYGHDVVGVDSSKEMLAKASDDADSMLKDGQLSGSISFEYGTQADALQNFGPGSFDLVLSHGVLMYHGEARSFVGDHLALVKPKGFFSLLTKNADALVFRAAFEGQIAEALKLVDDTCGLGHLGISTNAHTIQDVSDIVFGFGATIRSWAGVRIVSDTNPLDVEIAGISDVVELEWKLATREPHRRVGALLHAIILKGIDLTLLP